MKTLIITSFLFLLVFACSQKAYAGIIRIVDIDKNRSEGYAYVLNYWDGTDGSGNKYCVLNCEDPGESTCCWSLCSPIVTGKNKTYTYLEICDYIMDRISTGDNTGSMLYSNDVPITWVKNEDDSIHITIMDETEVKE